MQIYAIKTRLLHPGFNWKNNRRPCYCLFFKFCQSTKSIIFFWVNLHHKWYNSGKLIPELSILIWSAKWLMCDKEIRVFQGVLHRRQIKNNKGLISYLLSYLSWLLRQKLLHKGPGCFNAIILCVALCLPMKMGIWNFVLSKKTDISHSLWAL